MSNSLDRWYGFECLSSHPESPTGVLFEIRLAEIAAGPLTACCPICEMPCELKGSWMADTSGYGSTGDSPGQPPMLTDDLRGDILNDPQNDHVFRTGTPSEILLHTETVLRRYFAKRSDQS